MRAILAVSVAAASLALSASGCARNATPQELADATTRSVYAADYDGTTSRFDDSLKTQVTRSSLGDLSDRMHALGPYRGLAPASSDPDKGRYDYDAAFEKGTMLVQIRLDPTGKIAAYRVSPESVAATR